MGPPNWDVCARWQLWPGAAHYVDTPEARAAPCLFEQLPTVATVEVSFNGVDFTVNSQASFTWYNRSVLEGALEMIAPSSGPEAGGTVITIHGAGFWRYGGRVQGAKCQFGAAGGSPLVHATAIATSQLLCRSPPRPAGAPRQQPIFVTLSGYADSRTLMGRATDGHTALLPFRYEGAKGWGYLRSLHPFGGPVEGGSTLTLTAGSSDADATVEGLDEGQDFPDSSATPLCLFGAPQPLAVRAHVSDDRKRLYCRAPAAADLRDRGLRPPGVCAAVSSP